MRVLSIALPAVVSFAFLVQTGCVTPSSVAPLSVPLVYKTMATPGDFSTLSSCAAISDVQVIDARSDKAIGRRFVEDNAATVAPVTTASDVAAWVRTGALEILKQSGVSLGKPGAPVLRIAIEQIQIKIYENITVSDHRTSSGFFKWHAAVGLPAACFRRWLISGATVRC